MIKIKTYLSEHTLQPTIFPDGTSQVWNLPDEILECKEVTVIWNFESERELIDLLSLRALLSDHSIHLHIPYLPYGRQDKSVHNDATFNLRVLAQVLNSMKLDKVTSVDTHNPSLAEEIIDEFVNVRVDALHKRVIQLSKPEFILYPDAGAYNRYKVSSVPCLIAKKLRDQATGNIVAHELMHEVTLKPSDRILIIDDICDGGATFISIAKMLQKKGCSTQRVDLFVTHGIFSKGREHLTKNGISNIYTTNSLLKNTDGFAV